MSEKYDSPGGVLPSLYVGSTDHANNIRLLQRYGVTQLLCLDSVLPKNLLLPCIHVPMSPMPEDEMELSLIFQDCMPHIQAAIDERRILLVFCTRGFNRSPAVCIAYLVSELHWTLKRAYRLMQQCRGNISLHEHYFAQLQEMEANLHEGESTLASQPSSDPHHLRGIRRFGENDSFNDDEELSQAPLTDTSSRGSDNHTLDRASVATNISISTLRSKTHDLENFYTKEEDDEGEPSVPQVPLPRKKKGGLIQCCTQ